MSCYLMNSKDFQCGDQLSLDFILEMLGEVLKFPCPDQLNQNVWIGNPGGRIVKVSQVIPMYSIPALTSHMSVSLSDCKADQLVCKRLGWETAVCKTGQSLGCKRGS